MAETILIQKLLARYASWEQFSKSIGMPKSTIKRALEEGIRTTSLLNASRICEGLNVSLAEYLEPTQSEEVKRLRQSSHEPSFLQNPTLPEEARELYEAYLSSDESQSAIDNLLGYTQPSFPRIVPQEYCVRVINRKYGGHNKFAKAIGIPQTTVSSIFRKGFCSASVANAEKICAGLGLSVDEVCAYETGQALDLTEADKFYRLYQKHSNAQQAINMLLKNATNSKNRKKK